MRAASSVLRRSFATSTRGLSAAQVDQFHRDGFLVLERFWDKDTTRELRERVEELLSHFDSEEARSVFTTNQQTRTSDDYFLGSGDKIRFFFEEHAFDEHGALKQEFRLSINKIGHALHDLDEVFRRHTYGPHVTEMLRPFFRKPSIVQSMYIFKQPFIGGEVQPHQDGSFLYTEPQSCVGMWWALEDCSKGNGCLWATPGSHHDGVRQWFRRREDGEGTEFEPPTADPLPTEDAVPLEVEEGTLVMLHGSNVHFSDHNHSASTRHAYSVHVVETDGVSWPTQNWLQRPDPATPFRVLDMTQ